MKGVRGGSGGCGRSVVVGGSEGVGEWGEGGWESGGKGDVGEVWWWVGEWGEGGGGKGEVGWETQEA